MSVVFQKQFQCEKGYLICYLNGNGYVSVDGKVYRENTRIELTSGEHAVLVLVSNRTGFPSVFIESDVCPSDGSWTSNYCAGEFTPVGYNEHFDSKDKNPEIFPFEYENKMPVAEERINDGVLYDFGTELFGYLNISGANENEKMGVFYGESREEALDTEYSHISECIQGQKAYRLRQRAFRYIYIKNASAHLSVSMDYEFLPLEELGKFECDNALFNDIQSVAVYTFHLNCREVFFDGIKRDRWAWAGDSCIDFRINRYLFADKEIEERTLIGLAGKPPIEQPINRILDNSMYWLIMLYEHYMTYGDKVFLQRIYPMAKKILEFCESRLNEDGFIEGILDDWTFIDWCDMEKVGAVCAEQMLLVRAYFSMSTIAQVLGKSESKTLLEKGETLKQRVNEYYWDEQKGGFIDSYKSGNAHITRHANIFAVLYDIATEEQAKSILENVLKNDNVTKITTPYFEGYQLDVLAKFGEFEAIEERLTSYWGGMLKLGGKNDLGRISS